MMNKIRRIERVVTIMNDIEDYLASKDEFDNDLYDAFSKFSLYLIREITEEEDEEDA